MAQNSLDRALKNRGFGGLGDPAINQQLAFCVRDHAHFRQVLCGVRPEHRTQAYEAMRPHLRFEAKPLDVYMAEAADLAGRKESQQTPLDVIAQNAIALNIADETKKGVLMLTCSMCTREMAYPGTDRKDAYATARIDGWRIDASQEVMFCPACAKVRADFQRA